MRQKKSASRFPLILDKRNNMRREKFIYFGLSFLALLIFVVAAYLVQAINPTFNGYSVFKLVDSRENYVLEASNSASEDSLY